jgi:hypothetical protein
MNLQIGWEDHPSRKRSERTPQHLHMVRHKLLRLTNCFQVLINKSKNQRKSMRTRLSTRRRIRLLLSKHKICIRESLSKFSKTIKITSLIKKGVILSPHPRTCMEITMRLSISKKMDSQAK